MERVTRHRQLLVAVLVALLHGCTYHPTKPAPGTAPSSCGNDELQEPELCDGRALDGRTCRDVQVPGLDHNYYRGRLACATNCLEYELDGCSGFCGDGVIDNDSLGEPEFCDSAAVIGLTCRDMNSPGTGNFYAGTLRCQANCRGLDTSECSGFCGDGFVQGEEGERCDRSNVLGNNCRSLGFYRGSLRCDPTCAAVDTSGCSGVCGDNVTDFIEGERCDGTDPILSTCRDQGYYHGNLRCTRNCALDATGCFGRCGDGVVEPAQGEQCDGRQGLTRTCRDLGFYRGRVSCSNQCAFDTSQCDGFCGDGVCEDQEGENCANCASDCNCGIFGDCNPAGYCECVFPNTVVNCSNGCDAADRVYANCTTCGGPGCDEVPTVPGRVSWRQFLPDFPDTYTKCVPGTSCVARTGTLFFPDGCEPFFETQHTTRSGGQCVSDLQECTQLFIDDLEARGLWPQGRSRFGAGQITLVQLRQFQCR